MFSILISAILLPPLPPVALDATTVQGQPPLVLTAKVEKDQLITLRTEYRTVPQVRVVKVTNGGETREVKVTEYVTVVQKTKRAYGLTTATFTDAEGKKIDLPTLRKRLEKENPVLFSADGREVDKAYRMLFKKDVIVIVAKEVVEKKMPEKKR